MKRFLAYGLSLIAVLGAAVSIPAFAQYGGPPGGGAQVATPDQIKECEKLGIPVFTCTENIILAKKTDKCPRASFNGLWDINAWRNFW
ncbi:MAG: hypothetical protein HMLIMOIP_000678 [Candidatus Nitrosomirales archaeon]|jgi:hypothetical protein